MSKELCIVCSITRGRRVCKLNENKLICPICCAKTRIPECEGCVFYSQAEQFSRDKPGKTGTKKFIIKLDPELDELVDQALVKVDKGDIGTGKKIISDLMIKHPDSYTVHFGMGVIAVKRKRFDEAIKYFDRAIELNPLYVEAWFNKASCHHEKLEIGQMVRSYQKVIELGNPSEYFVRHARNILSGFAKNVRETSGLTLDLFLQTMDKFNEAFAAMENMEWNKAIKGFQEVLVVHPKHTQSYGNMGICYANLGRKQEALAALDKALELDPNYRPALMNREIVRSLEEGETLTSAKFASVDYYKDVALKQKSPF